MDQSRVNSSVPAFVLHRRAYRDSSLILELLTLPRGRVGAIARGVRGARSRWRALVEPFQPLLVSWQGRGELVTVTGMESVGPPLRFPGARLASGFYLNELVMRLLKREDAMPEVFAAYGQALQGLAGQEEVEAVCLRVFEKRLLQGLGYGLMLDRTADTGAALEPHGLYRYEPEYGPVAVSAPAAGVYAGRELLALYNEQLGEPVLRDAARRLMRQILRSHLGTRPLYSRTLYRQLRGRAHGANTKVNADD